MRLTSIWASWTRSFGWYSLIEIRSSRLIQYSNFSREESFTTPPPDLDEDIAQARELEERSRNALLENGCPPCYPSDVEFPLQNYPDEYEAVAYFQPCPGTGLVPLTAQLKDWNAFGNVQKRNRRHHSKSACLHFDPAQQNLLENWIEFQNYHLEIHENLQKRMIGHKNALNVARQNLGDSDRVVSHLEWKVKTDVLKLQHHNKMLRWIEQQRTLMTAE